MYLCVSAFISETTGPVEAKFHVEPPWYGGTKVCSNGPGHMISLKILVVVNSKHTYFGPRQANLILIACASSEGSGEPAHPRSLARTSAAHSYKQ